MATKNQQIIYNTATRKKQPFKPLQPGQVRMYVCGPTVYDFLHIGNYRGAIFFNMVRLWLEHLGYTVNYVYNYTDVDDKIIARSQKEKLSCTEITEKYIDEFEADYRRLQLKAHTHRPRCTEYIEKMIQFIQKLLDKNCAYPLDGDVYFSVEKFNTYGHLTNKKLDDLLAGTRAQTKQGKKHAADFVLWKGSKPNEPSWPSPWGQGRPGWHIECSTMAQALLGDTIDIHGGGMDLAFPHHENERAQSEACTGQAFVNCWMHHNMLELDSQKMSKSLGNIKTGRAFLNEYGAEVLKFMMLSHHYRSPIDFSEKQIHRAVASLAQFYSSLARADKMRRAFCNIKTTQPHQSEQAQNFNSELTSLSQRISKALCDDFNTPIVFSLLFDAMRQFYKLVPTQLAFLLQSIQDASKITPPALQALAIAALYIDWLQKHGRVMALFQQPPQEFLQKMDDKLLQKRGLTRVYIDQLVQQRTAARKNKDFATADKLRNQLSDLGILLQDLPHATEWEVNKIIT